MGLDAAIMYGAGVGRGDLDSLHNEKDGFLDRWEMACKGLVRARDEEVQRWVDEDVSRSTWGRVGGFHKYVPALVRTDRGPNLVGFWVVVGGVGVPGFRTFPNVGIRLSDRDLEKAFPLACRNSHRRWNRFSKWAGENNLKLPGPRLWLTTVPE